MGLMPRVGSEVLVDVFDFASNETVVGFTPIFYGETRIVIGG
jgi:hypothetical protein